MQSPVFVGRRDEVASLVALLDRAREACRSLRSSTRCATWPAPRRRASWPRCPARPGVVSGGGSARCSTWSCAGSSPGKVAAQLSAILTAEPAAGLVDLAFDRSGGNAYLVEELAGVVRGGGDPADFPPSLADVTWPGWGS